MSASNEALVPRERVWLDWIRDKGEAGVRNALLCRPPFSSDLCARASYGVRGEQTRVYTRRAMPRDLAIRAPGGLCRSQGVPLPTLMPAPAVPNPLDLVSLAPVTHQPVIAIQWGHKATTLKPLLNSTGRSLFPMLAIGGVSNFSFIGLFLICC